MPPPLKAASGYGVAYRPFTDDDLPFVSELYASTRRECGPNVGFVPTDEPSDYPAAILTADRWAD